MNITYTNNISTNDYLFLREAVGFKPLTERQAKLALENHSFMIVAMDGNKTVGMSRLVFDKAYVAVIVDVIVLPKYQRCGIGKHMIRCLMDYLEDAYIPGEHILVLLMAARGKEVFYKKFGFIERPNEAYGAGMSQWLTKDK
jgi:predicted N-acetyltransferase YhbS